MPVLPRVVMPVVVTHMDLHSMLTFRQTCKTSLRLVRTELSITLYLIVSTFVPNPALLLSKLNKLNAVVGGSAALSFFLRDVDVRAKELDIFVPVDRMPPLFQHFLLDQDARLLRPSTTSIAPHAWDFPDERCFTFITPFGTVNLWQSEAHTPFLPIVSSPTSLHILYVSPRHFGSAYPSLLFKLRALVARPDTVGFETDVRECAKLGIALRFFTSMWPDLAHHGPCAAKYFLCPAQQRTFADAGSLRARMDPLQDEELDAEVVWRLDYRPCGARCAEPTPELPLPCSLQDIL